MTQKFVVACGDNVAHAWVGNDITLNTCDKSWAICTNEDKVLEFAWVRPEQLAEVEEVFEKLNKYLGRDLDDEITDSNGIPLWMLIVGAKVNNDALKIEEVLA